MLRAIWMLAVLLLAGCVNPLANLAFDQLVVQLLSKVILGEISQPAAEIEAGHTATTAVVASGKRYCYDRRATPQYSVQLGGCLPGSAEISREEYDARP